MEMEILLTIGQFLGMLLVGIVIGILPYVGQLIKNKGKNKQNQEALLKEEFDLHNICMKDEQVYELLSTLRVKSDAARAQIAQFHNGGYFLDGSPMKKFSVTHESCEIGISHEAPSKQNVQLSMIQEKTKIIRDANSKIWITEKLKDTFFKSYKENHNVKAFAIYPFSKNNLTVGFVILEWSDIDKVPEDNKDFQTMFKKYTNLIEVKIVRGINDNVINEEQT